MTPKTLTTATSLRIPRVLGKLLAGACLALLSILATNTHAQEGKTILVLDASGSMWAKIADGYKIQIAQDVINDLLETLPVEQELGLITYGHRRKGDCGDIEMLVPPGAGTRGAIAEAVESLNPTGKTPLSAAVLQAADELRIEENAATVILLSDGRETCDLDPCAVGSELEDRGIDFTAHVIGFDIEEEKDREQLRCLAENTGGKFLTASTATELTEALATVSQPIERLTFSASVKDDEDVKILEGLTWTVMPYSPSSENATTNSSVVPSEQRNAEELRFDLDPGKYVVSVSRKEDSASTSLDVNVQSDLSNTFVLTLPALELFANLVVPDTVFIGQKFNVESVGPNLPGDRLRLALPGSAANESISASNLGLENTTELQAPTEPGEYEVRYVQDPKQKILATTVLIVKPSPATVNAANTGPQATSILVEWTGPDNNLDYIAVAKPGESEPIALARTRDGSPLKVQMPPDVGEYELRYVLSKDHKTLATRPITVIEAEVSFESPATAGVGIRISVPWTGPDEQFDHIAVVDITTEEVVNMAYMSWGNPVDVEMPTKTGEYELRYISNEFKAVLATRPITVTEATVSLKAPAEAGIGDTINVEWVGPDEPGDLIMITGVGGNKRYDLTNLRHGSPVQIQVPPEPGNYELRYVLKQGNSVLATRPITVTEVAVSLDAPDQAKVGESIAVAWTGPGASADRIAIAEVGKKRSINSTKISDGSPLSLQMPTSPGDYELRYVLHQGKTVLATRPITITEAVVSLLAPDEASVGQSVVINWEGPDANADSITVAKVGEKRSINYTYTREGNPLTVQMPTKPGEYELRYVLRQDRTTLATRPITVTEAEVSLDAPNEAVIGDSIPITWIGPDNPRDYIAVAEIGARRYINYTYTEQGNVLTVKMPPKPGEYEIRYVIGHGNSTIASHPITVVAATVSLDAPTEARIGESIPITWVGPNEDRDYIAVAKIGEKRYINYTYTEQGNVLRVQMPPKPGDYEIRYILAQGNTKLATRPIKVTAANVSLQAPDEVGIGESISVTWEGPNENRDYIAIAEIGSKRYITYAYTERGSPAEIKVPEKPGEYEIRYVLDQDKTTLLTRPISVR